MTRERCNAMMPSPAVSAFALDVLKVKTGSLSGLA
jgi:hypothetical protein